MIRFRLRLMVGVLLVVLLAAPAYAHLPRLITGRQVVRVRDPEVSQAFYAELSGEHQVYEISEEQGFLLYVSLLVPDLPGIRTVSATVVRLGSGNGEEKLSLLNGDDHNWESFYEPFAGDHYLTGPEFEQSVPAGEYRITVFNQESEGKYVLSVGRREVFTPAEMLHTIRTLPALKRDFFDKSPFIAYFNLVGLFMLIAVVVPVGLIWYTVRRLRRRRT